MTFKEKIEKKFNKLNSFYNEFEVPLPSLELYLYKKFPNNKWIGYLTLKIFDIVFICFWLGSLYYVSSVGNQCYTQATLFKLSFNNCTDFTCSGMNASFINISASKAWVIK
jgi:hypothetical protein